MKIADSTDRACCLFRTQTNDYFVGRLHTHRFLRNALEATFSHLVRIIPGEKYRWCIPVSEIPKKDYTILFENVHLTDGAGERILVTSPMGDNIVLTSDNIVAEAIDTLLIEGYVETVPSLLFHSIFNLK
jgi:hypothetical protein